MIGPSVAVQRYDFVPDQAVLLFSVERAVGKLPDFHAAGVLVHGVAIEPERENARVEGFLPLLRGHYAKRPHRVRHVKQCQLGPGTLGYLHNRDDSPLANCPETNGMPFGGRQLRHTHGATYLFSLRKIQI